MSKKAARIINKQRKKIAKLNRKIAIAYNKNIIRSYYPIDNSEIYEVLDEAKKAVRHIEKFNDDSDACTGFATSCYDFATGFCCCCNRYQIY